MKAGESPICLKITSPNDDNAQIRPARFFKIKTYSNLNLETASVYRTATDTSESSHVSTHFSDAPNLIRLLVSYKKQTFPF